MYIASDMAGFQIIMLNNSATSLQNVRYIWFFFSHTGIHVCMLIYEEIQQNVIKFGNRRHNIVLKIF